MSIESKVREVIAKQLNLDEAKVKPESSLLDDLGADSLDVTEIMMSFEDEFGIDVDDENLANIKTVADVIKYIESTQS